MSHPDAGWIAHPFSVPRALRPWLADRGSLTRRLKARCAEFQVRPLATGNARAHRDEHQCLGLRVGSVQYVRDVLLSCDRREVVFAHSVLPRAGLRGGWNRITRLGTRPLGEALFNDHRIRRKTLSYRRLDARHPLFRGARRQHPVSSRVLWARRSVFCLKGHALMVTEVFLPEIAQA